MTEQEGKELLAKLAALYQKSNHDDHGPWRVARERHNYDDGTTYFTHVRYTAHDCKGEALTVEIARYLTPELAELLVLSHNYLPDILEWARKGLEKS